MSNIIPAECFYPLEDAKKTLQVKCITLDKYFQLSSDVPREVLGEYHESFINLMKIIQVVRKKCEVIGVFLDHDFNNYITPLKVSNDKIRNAFQLPSEPIGAEIEEIPNSKIAQTHKKLSRLVYKMISSLFKSWNELIAETYDIPVEQVEQSTKQALALEMLKKYMYLNRGVINAIGSLRFYVDGTLEGKNILIVDFFNYQKEVFDRAFRGPIVYSFIEDVTAYFHADTLGNLLQNIFDNARKRGKATEVEVTFQSAGDKIEIIIKDNGYGLDPLEGETDVEDIFMRGRSRTGGTGLGLADAKERMAAMNASIICEGHGGLENLETQAKGACFRILLSQKHLF